MAKINLGITCLWDSRSTNSIIKRIYTKPYEQKIHSNNVEYSTAVGLYFTMHDAKVPFCMLEFSIIKITLHHFHVDNNEGDLGIGYNMIIGCYLMVHIYLLNYFKCHVLQFNGAIVPMKKHSGLIGKIK